MRVLMFRNYEDYSDFKIDTENMSVTDERQIIDAIKSLMGITQSYKELLADFDVKEILFAYEYMFEDLKEFCSDIHWSIDCYDETEAISENIKIICDYYCFELR